MTDAVDERPAPDSSPNCFEIGGVTRHIFVLGQPRCCCGAEKAPEVPRSREVRDR